MLDTLPDTVLFMVLLKVDNRSAMKNCLEVSKRMHTFMTCDDMLSLMWLKKYYGVSCSFQNAVNFKNTEFALRMIPMLGNQKSNMLQWIVQRGITHMIAPLIAPDINQGPLFHHAPNAATVVALLKVSGLDVNAVDTTKQTALHKAVYRNRTDLVAALLEAPGIDPNIRDSLGRTPLHMATSAAVVRELIKHPKLDVNARGANGYTPLHDAVFNTTLKPVNHQVVCELLKAHRIDVNATIRSGDTALHIAARGHKIGTSIAALLAMPGIQVNARNDDGQTPLHHAVIWSTIDNITMLASASGVDLYVMSTLGSNPLKMARMFRDADVIEALEQFYKR